MENLDNQPATDNSSNKPDLQAQINSLQSLVSAALVLIFIVAGAVNIYFWRQLRTVRAELTPLQQQSAQITAEVTKINAAANEFARRLIEFGKIHPDFQPVLNKYNLREAPATNAPAAKPATTTPTPAPAPKPAKK